MSGPQVDFGRLSGVLFGVCFMSAGLLVGLDQVTGPVIQANQEAKTKRALLSVLPPGTKKTDQAPAKGAEPGPHAPFTLSLADEWSAQQSDLVKILDRDQEKAQAVEVFRGYDDGGAVTGYAMVFELPDGYSGDIRFMVGVRYDEAIGGFRLAGSNILVHKETPGLGANIVHVDYAEKKKAAEEDRAPVPNFLGKLVGRDKGQFGLTKDGVEGGVDSLTAATITTRAYANALARILEMCDRNKDQLLQGGPGGQHATRVVPATEGRG